MTDVLPVDRELDAATRAVPRHVVVAAAIGAFREHAFHEVSLHVVAEQADLDLEDVLAHFATFDDLLLEVVGAWYRERMAPIVPIAQRLGAVALLRAVMVANLADPALMRLLSAMVNIAATPGHPLAAHLRLKWRHFHDLVLDTLERDVASGREPATADPARGAEQLVALYEGLQIQIMIRPEMDLLGAYDRAVTRLRRGWAEQYQPPVWQI